MHIVSETVYTYSVMKKFIIFNGLRRRRDLIAGGFSALFLMFITVGTAAAEGLNAFFFAVLACFAASLFLTALNIFIKPLIRAKNSLVAKDSVNKYTFTNVRIIIKSETADYYGEDTLLYNALKKVYETSGFFYLYINKKQAYIVSKANINSEDISMLREKLVSVDKH